MDTLNTLKDWPNASYLWINWLLFICLFACDRFKFNKSFEHFLPLSWHLTIRLRHLWCYIELHKLWPFRIGYNNVYTTFNYCVFSLSWVIRIICWIRTIDKSSIEKWFEKFFSQYRVDAARDGVALFRNETNGVHVSTRLGWNWNYNQKQDTEIRIMNANGFWERNASQHSVWMLLKTPSASILRSFRHKCALNMKLPCGSYTPEKNNRF